MLIRLDNSSDSANIEGECNLRMAPAVWNLKELGSLLTTTSMASGLFYFPIVIII